MANAYRVQSGYLKSIEYFDFSSLPIYRMISSYFFYDFKALGKGVWKVYNDLDVFTGLQIGSSFEIQYITLLILIPSGNN